MTTHTAPKAQEWGQNIIMTGKNKNLITTYKPRWWQFWRKPTTFLLEDGIQATKNKMLYNIIGGAFK